MPASYIARSNLVIPPEYVQQIIQSTVEQSAALSLCRRVNMGTLAQHLPVMSVLPSVSWVNPADTGRKETSHAEWEDVTLTAEELAVIVPVPEAVIADNSWDIFGEVRPRIAEAIGVKVDQAVFFGSGAPATFPTGGIYGHADAADNHIVTGDVTDQDIAGDISDLMELVEADGFDITGFAAGLSLKAKLRNLRDKNGNPIYSPGVRGSAEAPSLWGESIRYSRGGGWLSSLATLIGGDWTKAVIGVRQDMTFKVLSEATLTDGSGNVLISLAEQDMVALRCVMRLGFAIANPVTLANTVKDSRSPFAILAPAAA